MRIYITGYGVISSIGLNSEENFESLKKLKSGISICENSIFNEYKVGKIHKTNEELSSMFKLSTEGSRTSILGMIASKEAFQGHVLTPEIRTGLISGTSVGGMDISEKAYAEFKNGNLNIDDFKHHASGTTTEEIANELGLENCFLNTISTACSSAANAIMQGARMIQNNMLDRVIVGGTDSLTNFTFKGFRSLMIFDEEWCKPFDENRNGLNLGEGAGYLVIESERSLKITKKEPLAILSGWNNSSDAYHQTASSPEGTGAILSMTKALKMAKLDHSEIDYVNAHGTSTPNNDVSESTAFLKVFEGKVPAFSSTKGYTGHTLAASGGIEAVFAIFALRKSVLLPNLNFSTPIIETGLLPQTTFEENQKVKHVLSNSFGFGGNNSTLIISSIN